MGLFDTPAEKERKRSLAALEDKRLAFAQHLHEMGYTSERALYGQKGGGFEGVALFGNNLLYLTGPGPTEDADFSCVCFPIDQVTVSSEAVHIEPEGMGGVFGFGKRGAKGFQLQLSFPDGTQGTVDIVSGLNCVMQIEKGNDPLFSLKRRRGDSNVVWDFKPLEPRFVETIRANWLAYLGG